ncbi:MAG: AI-2E family transporter [Firmicutes bacterium]|nr:AI-2E family transporter [Bacillota bacterium]
MEEKKRIKSPYVKSMLAEAGAFCIAILFFFVLYRARGIGGTINKFISIMRPVVIGFIIAYLLMPVCRRLEKWFDRLFRGKYGKLNKLLSVVFSMIFGLLIVYFIIIMIVPQMYYSLVTLSNTVPDKAEALVEKAETIMKDNPEALEYLESFTGSLSEGFSGWLKNSILPKMTNLIGSVGTGVWTVVISIKDIIIGIVVSVYALFARRNVARRARMILNAALPPKWADIISEEFRFADRMFSGFMSGKLVDSAIIGVICYIFCLIAKMPSALLVSAVIGMTNIIPVFGPYFGAVPMSLLILIEDPPKCLIFIIFIIVLQQVDGNIIGPKILGNSTGLSGFSVLIAIILFGGIFGFIGLIIGVPLYAVIYDIMKKLVYLGLKKNGREYLAEPLEPKRLKAKKIYD